MQVSNSFLKVWAAVCFFGHFMLVAKRSRLHLRFIYTVNIFISKRIKNNSMYPRGVAQGAKIVSKINLQCINK